MKIYSLLKSVFEQETILLQNAFLLGFQKVYLLCLLQNYIIFPDFVTLIGMKYSLDFYIMRNLKLRHFYAIYCKIGMTELSLFLLIREV